MNGECQELQNRGEDKKCEWFHTQQVLDAWESSREGKMGEKNMPTWKHGRMAYVFRFLLAQGVKMRFPKTDGFSNSNLGCHTLPIPFNNQSNQFLAVINDWVNEIRKVVDSLMCYPSDIWLFPIGPKVLIAPLLILSKSFPFSLLLHWHSWLWVFLIKNHIYMFSKL